MTQPVKKFRAGQVNCALWENELTVNGRSITKLNATIERRYKDKNDKWQSSNSFGRNDIPLAIYCLGKAFECMMEERSLSGNSVEEETVTCSRCRESVMYREISSAGVFLGISLS